MIDEQVRKDAKRLYLRFKDLENDPLTLPHARKTIRELRAVAAEEGGQTK